MVDKLENQTKPTLQILIIRRIIEGVRAKNIEVILLFVDFIRMRWVNMEKILLAYALHKQTVIQKLHKNTKAMFRSLDGDIDFFDVGLLQRDT